MKFLIVALALMAMFSTASAGACKDKVKITKELWGGLSGCVENACVEEFLGLQEDDSWPQFAEVENEDGKQGTIRIFKDSGACGCTCIRWDPTSVRKRGDWPTKSTFTHALEDCEEDSILRNACHCGGEKCYSLDACVGGQCQKDALKMDKKQCKTRLLVDHVGPCDFQSTGKYFGADEKCMNAFYGDFEDNEISEHLEVRNLLTDEKITDLVVAMWKETDECTHYGRMDPKEEAFHGDWELGNVLVRLCDTVEVNELACECGDVPNICDGGHYCLDGECVKGCVNKQVSEEACKCGDVECPAGGTCTDGVCVEDPLAMDPALCKTRLRVIDIGPDGFAANGRYFGVEKACREAFFGDHEWNTLTTTVEVRDVADAVKKTTDITMWAIIDTCDDCGRIEPLSSVKEGDWELGDTLIRVCKPETELELACECGDNVCDEGTFCVDGECIAACEADTVLEAVCQCGDKQCVVGESCEEGKCVDPLAVDLDKCKTRLTVIDIGPDGFAANGRYFGVEKACREAFYGDHKWNTLTTPVEVRNLADDVLKETTITMWGKIDTCEDCGRAEPLSSVKEGDWNIGDVIVRVCSDSVPSTGACECGETVCDGEGFYCMDGACVKGCDEFTVLEEECKCGSVQCQVGESCQEGVCVADVLEMDLDTCKTRLKVIDIGPDGFAANGRYFGAEKECREAFYGDHKWNTLTTHVEVRDLSDTVVKETDMTMWAVIDTCDDCGRVEPLTDVKEGDWNLGDTIVRVCASGVAAELPCECMTESGTQDICENGTYCVEGECVAVCDEYTILEEDCQCGSDVCPAGGSCQEDGCVEDPLAVDEDTCKTRLVVIDDGPGNFLPNGRYFGVEEECRKIFFGSRTENWLTSQVEIRDLADTKLEDTKVTVYKKLNNEPCTDCGRKSPKSLVAEGDWEIGNVIVRICSGNKLIKYACECGASGEVCDEGKLCLDGVCQDPPPLPDCDEYTILEEECTCGSNECAKGESCQDGVCVEDPLVLDAEQCKTRLIVIDEGPGRYISNGRYFGVEEECRKIFFGDHDEHFLVTDVEVRDLKDDVIGKTKVTVYEELRDCENCGRKSPKDAVNDDDWTIGDVLVRICKDGDTIDHTCECAGTVCEVGGSCIDGICDNNPVCPDDEEKLETDCTCGDVVCEADKYCVDDECVDFLECDGTADQLEETCMCGDIECDEGLWCQEGLCLDLPLCDKGVEVTDECTCGDSHCDVGTFCYEDECVVELPRVCKPVEKPADVLEIWPVSDIGVDKKGEGYHFEFDRTAAELYFKKKPAHAYTGTYKFLTSCGEVRDIYIARKTNSCTDKMIDCGKFDERLDNPQPGDWTIEDSFSIKGENRWIALVEPPKPAYSVTAQVEDALGDSSLLNNHNMMLFVAIALCGFAGYYFGNRSEMKKRHLYQNLANGPGQAYSTV